MTGSSSVLGHATWLAARSAGIVALALLGAATLLGLLQSTRAFTPRRRMALRPLHEALAVSALGAIVLHAVFLLADPWLRPGLAGVLVPFASPWRPLAVALGVIAAYLGALFGPTYYLRERLGARSWRSLHRFAALAYGLAALHTITAGSDWATPWLRFGVGALTTPIVLLSAVRLAEAARSGAKGATREPARSGAGAA